jgi:carboxypeptidase C (cathepsin A)
MLALFALIVGLASAAIQEHRVDTLPGFSGKLPSTHYSGYIPVGSLSNQKGQLHYWFIESTKNPSKDPVVLWLNGGPGSSSLIGLLTENGQVITNDDSLTNTVDGVPQLFVNEYAWTTMANVVYLESPKGVGFSYCEGVEKSNDCVNTDESTAQDAYEFLVNFFAAYPEYSSNKFYITGESYAGIYIPMMIDQIRTNPLGANINFVGAAIGNGCWGNDVGTCAFTPKESFPISMDFYFGHGMFSQALKQDINHHCGDFSHTTPKCLELVGEAYKQMGKYNVYNIYDECGRDQRRKLESVSSATDLLNKLSSKTITVETAQSFKVSAGYSQALNDYECGAETAMDAYLADSRVIEALHVKADTPGMTYKKTASNLLPLYSELIDRYQILIYSGDTDGCVPYVGTEQWTRGLGYNVTADWHQWFSRPDDVHAPHKAGYAVTFDKFQFITINGAGHMVPQFQPAFSLTMFRKFLKNDVF